MNSSILIWLHIIREKYFGHGEQTTDINATDRKSPLNNSHILQAAPT